MLTDSHCHFHPKLRPDELGKFIDTLKKGEFIEHSVHLMTTQHVDIDYMDEVLLRLDNAIVVPYFGVHPWFSHLFAFGDVEKEKHYKSVLSPEPSRDLLNILPDPINLDEHVDKIKQIIAKHRLKVYGFGEIGLDKIFRVPNNGYLGNLNSDEEKLSPCKVVMSHQIQVLERFISLAKEFDKPVSLHCVKAHGALYDIMMKNQQVTTILHSYTGSIDQAKLWVKHKQKLYFSFSNWINGKRELPQLLEAVKQTQILIESDLYPDIPDYKQQLQDIHHKLNIDSRQLYRNMLQSINL